jgi:hypothetical protein
MRQLLLDPVRHWPKHACLGFPEENRRISIDLLTERFDHDPEKHHIIDLLDIKKLARKIQQMLLRDFQDKCSMN